MKKGKNSLIYGLIAVVLGLMVFSCSNTPSNTVSNKAVVNTQWKQLGYYINNVMVYDAVSNYGGVTYCKVWQFLANYSIVNNYSNSTIISSSTNNNIYTTETTQTHSNNVFYGSDTYYGVLLYTVSVSGSYLRLTTSSFNGTNSSGVWLSTNYNNEYATFEAF